MEREERERDGGRVRRSKAASRQKANMICKRNLAKGRSMHQRLATLKIPIPTSLPLSLMVSLFHPSFPHRFR